MTEVKREFFVVGSSVKNPFKSIQRLPHSRPSHYLRFPFLFACHVKTTSRAFDTRNKMSIWVRYLAQGDWYTKRPEHVYEQSQCDSSPFLQI
jgi:hypothetical protein